jgi:hypothetical protein
MTNRLSLDICIVSPRHFARALRRKLVGSDP